MKKRYLILVVVSVALLGVAGVFAVWGGNRNASTGADAADRGGAARTTDRTPAARGAAAAIRARPLRLVDSDDGPLAPGTRIRVFRKANATSTSALDSLEVPPEGGHVVDQIADSETSGLAYRIPARLFLVAQDEDGTLFWSVDPEGAPAYVDHDGITDIPVSRVDDASSAAARLRTMFPAVAAPGVDTSFDPWWALLLFGIAVGVGLSWLFRRISAGYGSNGNRGEVPAVHELGQATVNALAGRVVDLLLPHFNAIQESQSWNKTKHQAPVVDSPSTPPPFDARQENEQVSSSLKASREEWDYVKDLGLHQEERERYPAGRAPQAPAAEGLVAKAFVTWCNGPTGDISSLESFRQVLRGTLPSAEVLPLPRNMNSAEISFNESAKQRKDYWQVSVDGDTLLLPRPTTPQQFVELGPVFLGDATPRTIRWIRPARIRSEGDHWRLVNPGEVQGANA